MEGNSIHFFDISSKKIRIKCNIAIYYSSLIERHYGLCTELFFSLQTEVLILYVPIPLEQNTS